MKILEVYDFGKNDEVIIRLDFGMKFKDILKVVWLLVCYFLIYIKICFFRYLYYVFILM